MCLSGCFEEGGGTCIERPVSKDDGFLLIQIAPPRDTAVFSLFAGYIAGSDRADGVSNVAQAITKFASKLRRSTPNPSQSLSGL